MESSVSDLLRSTLRVALYDMVYECVGGWPRSVAGSLEGVVVVGSRRCRRWLAWVAESEAKLVLVFRLANVNRRSRR